MRLLLTRPRRQSEILARRLTDLGHDVLIEPMLSIENVRNATIDCTNPQAIIITSINGARAFSTHGQAGQFKDTPVYTVGPATAEELGNFNVVHRGSDGVEALRNTICTELKPDGGPVLYIRGAHVAGDLACDLTASGFKVDQVVLYKAVKAVRLSQTVVDGFINNRIDGVVLFSSRTAATFCKLVMDAGLTKNLEDVTFYCLSKNVSDSIQSGNKPGRRQVVIAAQPTTIDLINAVGRQ